MPGRYGNTEDYRYGFQGQESDDEITGSESHIAFKYRVHDARLGRFFSIDPLAPNYPRNAPYAFSENDVIRAVELEGAEKKIVIHHQTMHGGGEYGFGLLFGQGLPGLKQAYAGAIAAEHENIVRVALGLKSNEPFYDNGTITFIDEGALTKVSSNYGHQDIQYGIHYSWNYSYTDECGNEQCSYGDLTVHSGIAIAMAGLYEVAEIGALTKLNGSAFYIVPKSGVRLSGNAVNARTVSTQRVNANMESAGNKPAWKTGTNTVEYTTGEGGEQFVRVHHSDNRLGSWLMKADDVKGLTAAQIKDKFALPAMPTHVTDVHVPSGSPMRVGTVGSIEGYGNDGATQYLYTGESYIPGSGFTNTRALPIDAP
jgi:RHS repeat-associated protein